MKRIAIVGLVVMALLAGACTGKGGKTGATVPTERTTTTTTIDVTKIPDTITVDYANAVMKSLDHVLGDAIRDLVAKKAPDQHFYDLLNAIYDEPELSHQKSVYGQIAADNLRGMSASPGDPIAIVQNVLRSSSTCVVLGVERDMAPILSDPKVGAQQAFAAFVPKTSETDPTGANPSAWSMVFDGKTADRQEPLHPC